MNELKYYLLIIMDSSSNFTEVKCYGQRLSYNTMYCSWNTYQDLMLKHGYRTDLKRERTNLSNQDTISGISSFTR